MQNKKELGRKAASHITIFRAETNDDIACVDPNLVFHVGGVRETGVDNGDGEEVQKEVRIVYEGMRMRSTRAYEQGILTRESRTCLLVPDEELAIAEVELRYLSSGSTTLR